MSHTVVGTNKAQNIGVMTDTPNLNGPTILNQSDSFIISEWDNKILMLGDTRIFYFRSINAGNISNSSTNNTINKPRITKKRASKSIQDIETGSLLNLQIKNANNDDEKKSDSNNDNNNNVSNNQSNKPVINEDNNNDSNRGVGNGNYIGKAYDELQMEIIRIFTTKKYRFLRSLYIISWFVDEGILVALLIATILQVPPGAASLLIYVNNVALFAIIISEIIVEILQNRIHVWVINRLSIYIHILFYALYAVVFTLQDTWHANNGVITALYTTRLVAFILEIVIDYSIDLELHHDLANQKIQGIKWMDNLVSNCCCCQCNKYQNDVTFDGFTTDWEYIGSVCAWTPYNVYEYEPETPTKQCRIYRFVFGALTLVLFIVPGGIVYVIIGLCLVVAWVLGLICGKCGNQSICSESLDSKYHVY